MSEDHRGLAAPHSQSRSWLSQQDHPPRGATTPPFLTRSCKVKAINFFCRASTRAISMASESYSDWQLEQSQLGGKEPSWKRGGRTVGGLRRRKRGKGLAGERGAAVGRCCHGRRTRQRVQRCRGPQLLRLGGPAEVGEGNRAVGVAGAREHLNSCKWRASARTHLDLGKLSCVRVLQLATARLPIGHGSLGALRVGDPCNNGWVRSGTGNPHPILIVGPGTSLLEM